MTVRSDERAEFYSDILTTAIENYGYAPWFEVAEYRPYLDRATAEGESGWALTPHDAFARIVIVDDGVEENGQEYRVDLDFIAKGYGLLLHDAVTGHRLAVAYREMDAGDIDVCDALAILEYAIFGEPTFG